MNATKVTRTPDKGKAPWAGLKSKTYFAHPWIKSIGFKILITQQIEIRVCACVSYFNNPPVLHLFSITTTFSVPPETLYPYPGREMD